MWDLMEFYLHIAERLPILAVVDVVTVTKSYPLLVLCLAGTHEVTGTSTNVVQEPVGSSVLGFR